LKAFLKFNPVTDKLDKNSNVVLFHVDVLKDKKQKEYINKDNLIKICLCKSKDFKDNFDASLKLPTTLKEINLIVESTAAKKKFTKNSSIEIKNYLLNKNERKLSKSDNFIILTEKEVQLLELFLRSKKPLSKDTILSSVWNYSTDADTHTVETHIYRLRKKINDRFLDEKFILNCKEGYHLWKKETKLQRIFLQLSTEKG